MMRIQSNHDGICARLASIDISYEPRLFADVIAERAHMSHVSMAAGNISKDDSACDIIEASLSAQCVCYDCCGICRKI
jgi:hypothetical protein